MDGEFLDALLGYITHDIAFCRAYGHLFDLEDFATRAAADHNEREIVAGIILENWRRFKEPIGEQLKAAVMDAARKHRLPDSRRAKLLHYGRRVFNSARTAPDSIAERYLEFKKEALLGRILDDTLEKHAAQELTIKAFGAQVEKLLHLEARLAPPAALFNDAEAMEDRLRARENFQHTQGYWTLIDGLDDLLETPPRKGYFCLALALAKFGKSTFLSHIAIAGVIQRAKVLYITLEDDRGIVEARHDAIISGVKLRELGRNTAKVRSANKRFWANVRGRLKIVDGTGSSWKVSDVEALYLREKEQGFDADIVIVDYYLELDSVQQHREYRWKSDEISRDLRRFAAKRNVLLWTAHQSRIDADTMTAKEMGMGNSAEDRGLARKVHLMLGFGQGDLDMAGAPSHVHNIYVHIAASKFTPSKVGCNIITDYSKALFYDAEETRRRIKAALLAQADEAGGTHDGKRS